MTTAKKTVVARSSHAHEENNTFTGVRQINANTRRRYYNGRCTNIYVRSTCPHCGAEEFPNEIADCRRAKEWAEKQVAEDNASRVEDPRPGPVPAPWFEALFDSYDDYDWNG